MTTYFGILTKIGEAKEANAKALGVPVNITELEIGDGGGVLPVPSRGQTSLIGSKHRAPINRKFVDPNNPAWLVVEQVIPEQFGGWWARELGLRDADGDLIAVSNCPPTYKPQMAEGSARTQVVRMVLHVSSTSNFTLKIDPAVVLATRQYVDDGLFTKLDKTETAVDAHKFHTPRSISISGGAMANPVQFDGSRDLVLDVTGVSMDRATGVLAPIHGGTGLNWVPPGNYLVGNGTATMTSKTPGQVLRDIGAIPVGGAVRHVYLTTETDANTLIDDNAFYVWSNRVVMGANFPRFKSVGYLRVYSMASDCLAQEISLVTTGRKPYCFHRLGNPATGVWQPWKATSSFSAYDSMPNWDAGDIYVDGSGWYRWNGTGYALSSEIGSGQIAYFATDRNPSGWLKANGADVSRLVYSGLFSAIGTRYGAGDGVTTFTLPDLRGEFIRGWDDGRQVNPGRGLGTWEADAFQGHGHRLMRGSGSIGSGMYGAGFSSSAQDDTKVLEATGIGTNGAPRTANETRPRNIALLACIKI